MVSMDTDHVITARCLIGRSISSDASVLHTGIYWHCAVRKNPDELSLAIPRWVNTMSTSQRVVMLCSWWVKAGMAAVWWQVKLC